MIKKNIMIMIAVAAVIAGYLVGRMHYKMILKSKATAASLPGEDLAIADTVTDAEAVKVAAETTTAPSPA